MDINKKELKIPSFFMISNLGGGGSDKYRETVYMDLYYKIPILFNYYYLKYPDFGQKWIRNISNYSSISDFLSYVRNDMITNEKFISKYHSPKIINYNEIVYLLDSGAANIVNKVLKHTTSNDILDNLLKIMQEYYIFANKYKFDLVIGFDLGGKYTFKGEERYNQKIIDTNKNLKQLSKKINEILLKATVEFLNKQKNYYPKVLATVHGNTPEEYETYTKLILSIEKQYNYKFWGIALGGVASAKNKDESWFTNDIYITTNKNATLVKYATSIVKKIIPDRPIHILGGGGKDNIVHISEAGATSFDSQSPGRRAYDGNEKSVSNVFDTKASGSFSKYLVGQYDNNLKKINTNFNFEYYPINKIPDDIELCGCPSCQNIKKFKDIKKLYSLKTKGNNEDYYYARQLCNAHSIWQHIRLCEKIKQKI